MQKHVQPRRYAIGTIVLGLLAAALPAACRQQPTPQPLPDPMTQSAPKTVAGSTVR